MNFGKNTRVVVVSGPYEGRAGKVIRRNGSEWMVKLDNRFFPNYFKPGEITPEKP